MHLYRVDNAHKSAYNFQVNEQKEKEINMSTTIGTLISLAIYVGLVVVGAVIGSQCSKRGVELPWLGKFQFVALMILIVTLGIKLGANDEVIGSLGQIGLAAFVIMMGVGFYCLMAAL